LDYNHTQLPRALKAGVDSRGYRVARLYNNGESKFLKVHRLVLEAFVGPCPLGLQADHIDRDKTNNRISNLRWVSCSENNKNRDKYTQPKRTGEKNWNAKLKNCEVEEIYRLVHAGICGALVGRMFGLDKDAVSKIKLGKRWAHVTQAL